MSLFYSTLCWGTEESFSSNRTATDLNSQERFALAWEQSSSAASGQGNKPWEKVPWAEGLLLANPALPCSQLHAAQQTQQWGWGVSNIMQEACDRFRAHILQLLLSWPAPYGMSPGEILQSSLQGGRRGQHGAERDLPIWAAPAQPCCCFYFHAVGDWVDIESSPFLADTNASPMLTQGRTWNPTNLVNSNHEHTSQ